MEQTILSARNVRCTIGRYEVLHNVNLDVFEGEMVALIGPNGAGKSTLLRALAGISSIPDGVITVKGVPLQDYRPRQRAQAIALVAQKEAPQVDLLVREVVALGLIPQRSPWEGGGEQEKAVVDEALAQLHMSDYAERSFMALSGGEQRRVLLARGLAQRTDLLMLDEPTNHLDIHHQHSLLRLVCSLGQTVIAAIHDLDLAATYFDRVVVLSGNTIAAVGDPQEVLTPELVDEVFDVSAVTVHHPHSGRKHLLFG